MSNAPTDSFAVDERVRRPPWYRRLAIWLGLRPPPLPHSDHRPSDPQHPRLATPEVLETQELKFESPAHGDLFNFSVTVRCTWRRTVDWADRQQLMGLVIEQKRQVPNKIHTIVRGVTREFPPDACAEVERSLNDALTRSLSIVGAGPVTCEAQATVELDPAIRSVRREASLHGIRAGGARDTTRQQVERYREEVSLWRGLLHEWGSDQTTIDAVLLTLRPDQLEQVVGRPRVSDDPVRERLLEEANRWLAEAPRLGIEEAFFRFDTAVATLLRHLGISPSLHIGSGNGSAGSRDVEAPDAIDEEPSDQTDEPEQY